MNRFFDLFNLLGICVVAFVCAAQWSANGRLGRQNDRLETIRLEQAATIDQDTQKIKGQAEDLDEFRTRLSHAESELSDLSSQLSKVTAERNQFGLERDRLKADLERWVLAVKGRDDLIKQAGSEIQALAKQRDDIVKQFNALVSRFNTLEKQTQK